MKNSPTESTLDLPYGEIQEIYEKGKNAKVNELKIKQQNSPTESTIDSPFDEIQEIYVLFCLAIYMKT